MSDVIAVTQSTSTVAVVSSTGDVLSVTNPVTAIAITTVNPEINVIVGDSLYYNPGGGGGSTVEVNGVVIQNPDFRNTASTALIAGATYTVDGAGNIFTSIRKADILLDELGDVSINETPSTVYVQVLDPNGGAYPVSFFGAGGFTQASIDAFIANPVASGIVPGAIVTADNNDAEQRFTIQSVTTPTVGSNLRNILFTQPFGGSSWDGQTGSIAGKLYVVTQQFLPNGSVVTWDSALQKWIAKLPVASTTNTLSSNVNTMTSNVNGVVSSAPIVTGISGSITPQGQLVITVNGQKTNNITLPAGSITNVLNSAGNVLTSTVNGVSATANIINLNAAVKPTANQFRTVINDTPGTIITIVDSVTTSSSLATGELSTAVNGVNQTTPARIDYHRVKATNAPANAIAAQTNYGIGFVTNWDSVQNELALEIDLQQYGLSYGKPYRCYDPVHLFFFGTAEIPQPFYSGTLTLLDPLVPFATVPLDTTITGLSQPLQDGQAIIIGDQSISWSIRRGYYNASTGRLGSEAFYAGRATIQPGTYTVYVAPAIPTSVTTLNGVQGTATLQGGNNVQVNTSGQVITINSTSSASSGNSTSFIAEHLGQRTFIAYNNVFFFGMGLDATIGNYNNGGLIGTTQYVQVPDTAPQDIGGGIQYLQATTYTDLELDVYFPPFQVTVTTDATTPTFGVSNYVTFALNLTTDPWANANSFPYYTDPAAGDGVGLNPILFPTITVTNAGTNTYRLFVSASQWRAIANNVTLASGLTTQQFRPYIGIVNTRTGGTITSFSNFTLQGQGGADVYLSLPGAGSALPNLQQVTNQGSTTTNVLTVGGLTDSNLPSTSSISQAAGHFDVKVDGVTITKAVNGALIAAGSVDVVSTTFQAVANCTVVSVNSTTTPFTIIVSGNQTATIPAGSFIANNTTGVNRAFVISSSGFLTNTALTVDFPSGFSVGDQVYLQTINTPRVVTQLIPGKNINTSGSGGVLNLTNTLRFGNSTAAGRFNPTSVIAGSGLTGTYDTPSDAYIFSAVQPLFLQQSAIFTTGNVTATGAMTPALQVALNQLNLSITSNNTITGFVSGAVYKVEVSLKLAQNTGTLSPINSYYAMSTSTGIVTDTTYGNGTACSAIKFVGNVPLGDYISGGAVGYYSATGGLTLYSTAYVQPIANVTSTIRALIVITRIA